MVALFLLFLNILESMWGIFFISLFFLCNSNFVIHDIFGNLSLSIFLCIFSFEIWISDEEVMSFFIYLILRIHALLCFTFLKSASIFIQSSSFLLWLLWYLNASYSALFLGILASNVLATIFSFKQKIDFTQYYPLSIRQNCAIPLNDDQHFLFN